MKPQFPQQPISKWIVFAILAISFLGFLDATYLTINHYSGGNIECNILAGCDTVTQSKYAVILGIPVALMGALFYLTMLISSLLYLDRKNTKAIYLASYLTIFGFVFSLWFTAVQVFILHAYCQYCLVSAIFSTILFILGIWLIYKRCSYRKTVARIEQTKNTFEQLNSD